MKHIASALTVVVAACTALYFASPVVKEGGTARYYTMASSSIGVEDISMLDYFKIKADSVFVNGKCDVDEILNNYGAEVVRVERVDGITNYYCFSLRLPRSVKIGGERVNLHIAVAEYGYTVASPLAFGSY